MTTLAEIESAMTTLPAEEKYELYRSLEVQLRDSSYLRPPSVGHRVIDIPVIQLGGMLQPLTRDDDLLEEMLEGRT